MPVLAPQRLSALLFYLLDILHGHCVFRVSKLNLFYIDYIILIVADIGECNIFLQDS